MGDKPWKAHEREVAKKLGGVRALQLGRGAPDVLHPDYTIECKYRLNLPKLITDGLKQANSYNAKKIPLLVLRQARTKGEIVCMYMEDFIRLREGQHENQGE